MALVRSGSPFPPWDRQPTLDEELEWVRDAWIELDSCRERGMTLGRIPWTAIQAFAQAEGVVDPSRFRQLIRHLDDQFLAAHHRQVEGARQSGRRAQ